MSVNFSVNGKPAEFDGPGDRWSPETLLCAALADHRVTIPMAGGAESLNVAAAAAICLYEHARRFRGPAAPA